MCIVFDLPQPSDDHLTPRVSPHLLGSVFLLQLSGLGSKTKAMSALNIMSIRYPKTRNTRRVHQYIQKCPGSEGE